MSRVLVIDDHPIVLQGCRQLLADAGVDEIVLAQTLAEALNIYRKQKPEVIIIDLAMQTDMLGGLLFIQGLRKHDRLTPLLVFTMHRDPIIVRRAIELGATGYMLKDAPPEEFMTAFRMMCAGRCYLSHELASDMAFKRVEQTDPLWGLTPRELQTLTFIAEGQTFGVIAENLKCKLQNRGEHLHSPEGEAWGEHASRTNAARH